MVRLIRPGVVYKQITEEAMTFLYLEIELSSHGLQLRTTANNQSEKNFRKSESLCM